MSESRKILEYKSLPVYIEKLELHHLDEIAVLDKSIFPNEPWSKDSWKKCLMKGIVWSLKKGSPNDKQITFSHKEKSPPKQHNYSSNTDSDSDNSNYSDSSDDEEIFYYNPNSNDRSNLCSSDEICLESKVIGLIALSFKNNNTNGNLLSHIQTIGIRDGWRRQNLAEFLILGVLLQYPTVHCFDLEVRCSNTPAINLYKKLGFSVSKVRPGYYDDPKEDAWEMVIYDKIPSLQPKLVALYNELCLRFSKFTWQDYQLFEKGSWSIPPPSPPPPPPQEEDEEEEEHMQQSHLPTACHKIFWICDGCDEKKNALKVRYRCKTCKDYDFCLSCARTKSHNHSMDRIPIPHTEDWKCDSCHFESTKQVLDIDVLYAGTMIYV